MNCPLVAFLAALAAAGTVGLDGDCFLGGMGRSASSSSSSSSLSE